MSPTDAPVESVVPIQEHQNALERLEQRLAVLGRYL